MLVCWVQVVYYHVGVALVARGEYYQLEMFGELLEAVLGVGADVDTCVQGCAVGECDWQGDVVWHRDVLIAMNQGLIQIEHNRLPAPPNRLQRPTNIFLRPTFPHTRHIRQYIQRSNQMSPTQILKFRQYLKRLKRINNLINIINICILDFIVIFL